MENPRQNTHDSKVFSNMPYVIAIIAMLMVACLCIAAILIFSPNAYDLPVIAKVFGFLVPTTVALLAFLKTKETHSAVNSRLDEWMKHAERIAFELGRREGIIEGTKQADKRTDVLRHIQEGENRTARSDERRLDKPNQEKD